VDELGWETETHYDQLGRARVVLGPPVDDGLDPETVNRTPHIKRPETSMDYDPAGNLKWKKDPLGRKWIYLFDGRNRLLEEQQPAVLDSTGNTAKVPVVRTGYDYVGNVTWRQDSRGYATETEYDEHNRPLIIRQPRATVEWQGAIRIKRPEVRSLL
jgi:uncharacterized protein RhaS with RHS repeats